MDDVALLAIAKGPERNAGREHLYRTGRPPMMLEPRDPSSISYNGCGTKRTASLSEVTGPARQEHFGLTARQISGIGAKRKKALLLHFGSAQSVARAGLADLEAVEGISRGVAQKIYGHFHEDQ